jgi:two-component system cell cycle sensor histidine kinase/response regulator CckA
MRRLRPIEILLVEDSPADKLIAVEALEHARVLNNLHAVEDGVEALAFLRREGKYQHAPRPDLILLDLNMPRKDGREVLQEVKSDPSLTAIPVVVLTSSHADEDIMKAYGFRANSYVTKPVDFPRFTSVIQSIQNFWFEVVTLPTLPPGRVPGDEYPKVRPPQGQSRMRVLFVEDNPADALLTREALKQSEAVRFECIHVARVAEALEQLDEKRFDLILTDLNVPDGHGLETFLRLQQAAPNLPIIVMTGNTDEAAGISAMQAGAADYLTKGVTPDSQIVRSLRYAIERKRSEEAVRSSEEQLRMAVESQVDGFCILTAIRDENGAIVDFRYKYINEAGCRLNLRSREDQIGASLLELLPEMKSSGLLEHFINVVESGITFSREAFPYEDTFGTGKQISRPFDLRAVKMHDGIALSWRDVSRRVKLEAQLLQAQKMESVGQLAGGIAHDFNNILTIIQGHAELLQTRFQGSGEIAESVNEICESAERAANLTRQLLTFSRRHPLKRKEVDLNQVVGKMTRMLARLLGEDVGLQMQLAAELPPILADEGMMEQVIVNLAVNARDAMPQGGKLTIQTSSVMIDELTAAGEEAAIPGPAARLTVSDTGLGIDPQVLPQIFEPFFTTKEAGKGTGLGLATVYGIVKQHEGWLRLRSEQNRGTSFEIYFPQCKPVSTGRAAVVAKPEVPPAPSRGSETILVVEDERHIRALITSILKAEGYTVLEAAHGVKAREIWNQHRDTIDLLLTDMVMPEGVTGRELLEHFQAEKPSLKFVFSSGYSLDLLADRRDLVLGKNYLQKPYRPNELLRIVRASLSEQP